jgi:hypothetical protein
MPSACYIVILYAVIAAAPLNGAFHVIMIVAWSIVVVGAAGSSGI